MGKGRWRGLPGAGELLIGTGCARGAAAARAAAAAVECPGRAKMREGEKELGVTARRPGEPNADVVVRDRPGEVIVCVVLRSS